MSTTDLLELSELLETYNTQPVYILSGSGPSWYYSDVKRTMVKVSKGSECLYCEEDPANNKRCIVQIGSEIFSIPKVDLIEVGWN